jgi:hypothetical protein
MRRPGAAMRRARQIEIELLDQKSLAGVQLGADLP